MVKTIKVIVFLALTTICHGAVLWVPVEYDSISEAVSAAHKGDVIEISAGTYTENLVIEKPISIIGKDQKWCVIKSADGNKAVITVDSDVSISGLTIRGGNKGVYVNAGRSLEIVDCNVTQCREAGVSFESSFNSTIFMDKCWVTENGDGVKLRSTQGTIMSSSFLKNRDDGIDLEGDVGVLCYNLDIKDSGDDGIEVRLGRRSNVLILRTNFSNNKEDGIEIINSSGEDEIYNLVCVQMCIFEYNCRYGVGFVSADTEQYTGETLNVSVYAPDNEFKGVGVGMVSDNYLGLFKADKYIQNVTHIKIKRKGREDIDKYLIVKNPLLVGIYNLRPTTDGTFAGDGEGVTVLDDRIFVADDNREAVYVLDRKTGAVVKKIELRGFVGDESKSLGLEGVDIVKYEGKDALLISDDNGRLFTVSIDEDTYGHILRQQSTGDLGFEGIEQLGDKLLALRAPNKVYLADKDDPANVEGPVTVEFDPNFGRRIAGVGVDSEERYVYMTASGNNNKESWRNYKGVFFEMNSELTDVLRCRRIGAFSNDPRGICVSDGLVYVSDGRGDFENTKTGEMYRGGIKVFVFMLEDKDKESPSLMRKLIPFLPVRKDPMVK